MQKILITIGIVIIVIGLLWPVLSKIPLGRLPRDVSSQPREPPPELLTVPDVNLSAHPAPIVQPPASNPFASDRKAWVLVLQFALTNILPCAYDPEVFCISSLPI